MSDELTNMDQHFFSMKQSIILFQGFAFAGVNTGAKQLAQQFDVVKLLPIREAKLAKFQKDQVHFSGK